MTLVFIMYCEARIRGLTRALHCWLPTAPGCPWGRMPGWEKCRRSIPPTPNCMCVCVCVCVCVTTHRVCRIMHAVWPNKRTCPLIIIIIIIIIIINSLRHHVCISIQPVCVNPSTNLHCVCVSACVGVCAQFVKSSQVILSV